MRPIEELREEASHVILHVGDMIYDVRTKSRGFLRKRERKIDLPDYNAMEKRIAGLI